MKITRGTIIKTGLPVLAAACFSTSANAQMLGNTSGTIGVDPPDPYECSADFSYTHQDQLISTIRSFQCNNTLTYLGSYYDTSDGMIGAETGEYVTLKCVDFSIWSTEDATSQTLFIRIYLDLDPSTLVPDTNEGLLVSEDSFVLGPHGGWANSNSTNACCQGHPDGDKSMSLTGTEGLITGLDGLGVLMTPDQKFWVEIGHEGESRTRHATYNDQGPFWPNFIPPGTQERRDHVPALDYAGTWARNTNGCTGFPNWGLQETVWGTATNRDYPTQLHFTPGDSTLPPSLPFGCPSDFTGAEGSPDGVVGIEEFLGVLANWGALAPPRPDGDVAPCDDTFATDCRGDNEVGILDFLEVLADWGECPNNVDDCEEVLNVLNQAGYITVDGTYPFEYNPGNTRVEVLRPDTNSLAEVLAKTPGGCGWANYGTDAIPGGFAFGDSIGVDREFSLNTGDVWFTYLAPGNGRAFFDSAPSGGCGSLGPSENAVNVIEVYPGGVCPESWLESIDCGESNSLDCLGFAHGRTEINVVGGEEYLVRMGSWVAWEAGIGELTTSFVDNCVCAAALPMAIGGSTSGNTEGACIDGGPGCSVGTGIPQTVGGRWYMVVGDGNTLTASTAGTVPFEDPFDPEEPIAFDSAISVYCNNAGELCPANLATFDCVASSAASFTDNFHETVSWCSTTGQEYFILVHGNPSGPISEWEQGFFVLDVSTDAVVCLGAASCGQPRPGNDNCSAATSVVEVGPPVAGVIVTNIAVNTNNASTEPLEASAVGCGGIDETVWYSFTPSQTGNVTFSTCSAANTFNSRIEVYDAATGGSCPLGGPSLGILLCANDTLGCPLQGFFSAPILLFAGQTVIIKIGSPTAGQSGIQQGTTTLTITNTVSPSSCPQVCDVAGVLEGGGNGELLFGDGFIGFGGYSNLEISAVVGTFEIGEEITGGTSAVTANVNQPQLIGGVDSLLLAGSGNTFTLGETITGGTSGATATVGTQTDFTGSLEQDFTNGGCDLCVPLFDALAENDIVCGQSSTYADSFDGDCDLVSDGAFFKRDTDWFAITIPDTDDGLGGENRIPGSRVTLTISSEFPALFGFTEAVCGANPSEEVPFVASATSGGLCTDSAMTVDLAAGDYYVLVTTFNLSGVDPGNATEGHDYQLSVGAYAPSQLAPSNDDCADATDITANIDGLQVVSDNRFATDDGSEPAPSCHSAAGSLAGSVWYSFVASSANMTVSTCSSIVGTNSTLAVYSGDCLTLVEVGCAEDECGVTLSTVDLVGLTPAETYFIMLGGNAAADQSVFRITITNTP